MDELRSKRLIKYREIVHGIPNKYSIASKESCYVAMVRGY